MTAVLTWPEWLWAGVPMFFVGWFGCAVYGEWERKRDDPMTAAIEPYVLGYLRNIDWAVTTEHDCWGELAPPEGEPAKYALYDAGEDDPPIAVFTFREDAEAVCEALHWAAGSSSEAPR